MRPTSSGTGTRANLLDIQTVEGNLYYWSDRALANVLPALSAPGPVPLVTYQPWLLTPPSIKSSRSLVAETGTVRLQNIYGDTISRTFQQILRRSAMEGALCVYRWWNVAAEVADFEFHGRVSVSDVSGTDATLQLGDVFDFAVTDAPGMTYSETCQLIWSLPRCGATGPTECMYSLPTCQVPEHFTGIENTFYDKNYAEAIGAVPTTVINRRRRL